MLCDHKDIFGKPAEGLHSTRIFDYAAVDLIATGLASYAISRYFDNGAIAFIIIFILLILVSIPVHKTFCVNTTLVKQVYV